MSFLISLSPALLGFAVILQAGLNRKIGAQWGLASAVLLNALVFAVVATLVYWKSDLLPQSFRSNLDIKTWSWWFLIPGLLGCMLVFGGPIAIAKWGAVHTFIMIISAQLLGSLIWDWKVESMEISNLRIAGIILAWVGAIVVCKS